MTFAGKHCAIAFLQFLNLISPVVLVRFGYYRSFRIGSMVGDTDVVLARCESEGRSGFFRNINIFISEVPESKSANKFVTILWRRSGVKILRYSKQALHFWFLLNDKAAIEPKLSKHLINGVVKPKSRILDDRDLNCLTENTQPRICLSSKERASGLKWLAQLGISPDAKIALLLGRDPIYGTARGDNPSFHSHRNMNINSFDLAALELVKNGYYVFRMGSMVKDAFKVADEKHIFDYALNGMRTEFLDVFLASMCELIVSVSSGYDALPLAFRKPIVYVNYPVLGTAPLFRRNSLILCKIIKDKLTHKTLTIRELYERDILFEFDSEAFDKANCYFVDNTNVEICNSVGEMLGFLKDKSLLTEVEDSYQSLLFRELAEVYVNAPEDLKCPSRAKYSTWGLLSGHYGILPAGLADVTQIEG